MKQNKDPLHKYKMNYLSDSGEFQEVESKYSGNFHTFPVNQQGFQVRYLC